MSDMTMPWFGRHTKNLFPGYHSLFFVPRLEQARTGMLVAAGLVGVFSILVGIGRSYNRIFTQSQAKEE